MEIEQKKKLQELEQIARSYWWSRVFLTACELDLFTVLGTSPKGAGDLARELGASVRGTEILCDALVALGVIIKGRDGCYSNSDLTYRFLSRESGTYRGAMFLHQNHLWDRWSGLTEVVLSGEPVGAGEERTDEERRDFILAMHHLKGERFTSDIHSLDLRGVHRALDLGGGPGTASIAMAEAEQNLEVVLMDFAYALDVARTVIPDELLRGGRIRLREGNFLEDDIGRGYDFVLVSAVVHIYGSGVNRQLLGKVYQALNPGGRVAIRDLLIDPDRTKPLRGALFAVNMLVNTQEGRCYTEEEIRTWLVEEGFSNVSVHREEDGSGTVIAERSG